MNHKTIAREKERQQQIAILNQVAEEMHKKGVSDKSTQDEVSKDVIE